MCSKQGVGYGYAMLQKTMIPLNRELRLNERAFKLNWRTDTWLISHIIMFSQTGEVEG